MRRHDGRHEGVDDLALDPVRQMPRIGHVLVAAPPVRDLEILAQRVGDQREGAPVLAESFGQGFRGPLPPLRLRVLQQAEGGFERQGLAVDVEAQRRDGLVEKAGPGRTARDGLFVEELFELGVELVGTILADVVEPRLVATERVLRGQAVENRVGDAVELQNEEQEVGRNRRDPILGVGQKLGPGGVGRVLGIDELGERGGAAQHLLEPLVGLDGFRETLPAIGFLHDRGQLTTICRRETLRILLRGHEVGRIGWRVHARVEIGKVPGRHGSRGFRGSDGTGLMKGGTTAKRAS